MCVLMPNSDCYSSLTYSIAAQGHCNHDAHTAFAAATVSPFSSGQHSWRRRRVPPGSIRLGPKQDGRSSPHACPTCQHNVRKRFPSSRTPVAARASALPCRARRPDIRAMQRSFPRGENRGGPCATTPSLPESPAQCSEIFQPSRCVILANLKSSATPG